MLISIIMSNRNPPSNCEGKYTTKIWNMDKLLDTIKVETETRGDKTKKGVIVKSVIKKENHRAKTRLDGE